MMKSTVAAILVLLCAGSARAQLDRVEDNSKLPLKIIFNPGTAVMNDSSVRMLNFIKDYLNRDTTWTLFRIEGHVFGEKDNMGLSQARAMAVVKWLVAHDVDCKRLIAVGFGDRKPVFPEGDPRNTRISYINAERNHQSVSNRPACGGGMVAGNPCP